MSRTFTKLFSSITASTVWCEPDRTRLVWITMLAMADHAGRVHGSIPGLAHMARVPIEDCETALHTFLSPDPYSRTPDFEGRRIEVVDGGWRLLNYAKHRGLVDAESVKESKRNYINKRRAVERGVESVESVDIGRTQATQEEEEAEAEVERAKTKTKADAPSAKRGQRLPADWQPSDSDVEFAHEHRVNWRQEVEAFRDYWHSKSGADAAKLDWSATWRNWVRRSRKDLKPATLIPAKSKTRQAIDNIGRMINAGTLADTGDRDGIGEIVGPETRRLSFGRHDRSDGSDLD